MTVSTRAGRYRHRRPRIFGLLLALLPVSLLGAEVSSVSPARVELVSGQTQGVSLSLSGSGLETLSGAQVVNAQWRVEKGFVVSLGRGDDRRRVITLSAPRQPPGDAGYRLRLLQGRKVIDLSPRQLDIRVIGQSVPAGHPLVGQSMQCGECHGAAGEFSWLGDIRIADVYQYSLHRDAMGQSIQAGIQGQVALRPDGVVCTACHNANPGDPQIGTMNYQSASKAFACQSIAPLIVNAQNKPPGLVSFLTAWKNAGCP